MASPVSILGRTLGHYRIVEQIGAGGMGVVYRAFDERLDREVAVKVLPPGTLPDLSSRKRFREEARALSRLNHPNIATIHDFDTQDCIDFLVTELVPGTTLSDKLAAGALSEKEVVRIGEQMFDGLEAAHRAGIIHGDLKPSNLRLTPEGRLKILDFGLATRNEPAAPDSVTITARQAGPAGTLAYMAPEQLTGEKADHRADLWSAGVVLYEMSTGRPPFEGKTSTLLADAILHAAPATPGTPLPGVSRGLSEVICKCLDKDPEHRYQSAKEVAVDLRRVVRASSLDAAAGVVRRRRSMRPFWVAGVVAVALLLAAIALWNAGSVRSRFSATTGTPHIQAIAVLPLANLSNNPEQEYLADGMTEALIADLSQIRALKVISRTSVMQYKKTKERLPQIARALGVDAVMEGSVMREGGRVRVSVQLIDGATDQHLWAREYDKEYGGILALQKEVARAVAEQIQVRLSPQEQAGLAAARSVDPQVQEMYLKGRYYFNQRTAEALQRSVGYFQQAIAADTSYALAYCGLADAYALLAFRGSYNSQDALSRAKTAALKGIELDPTLADPHASLAFISETQWDWATAEREYQRALELNPGDARAHHWYAGYLMYVGRFDQGIAEARRARDLDPLSLPVNNALAGRLLVAGRVEEALQQLQKTLEMNPGYSPAHQTLGWAYLNQGKNEDAIRQFQQAIQLSGSNDVDLTLDLGFAYAVSGHRPDALRILTQLKKDQDAGKMLSGSIAILYGALGDLDQAFAWLNKAYDEHDPELTYLKVPRRRFAPLRQDPRYKQLLVRMGLPDE